jgi:CTP synthase (UTP-ammonia lyase)
VVLRGALSEPSFGPPRPVAAAVQPTEAQRAAINAIAERHRHRYEVNTNYIKDFEKHGVSFSGMSPDGRLPELIELKNHPFFIAVQFHPEFKSRPFDAHPIFSAFVKSAKETYGKQKGIDKTAGIA